MREGFAELRGEMAGLGKSFAEERTANVKWMLVAGTAFTSIIVAVLGSWTTLATRQSVQQQSAPAPTIIYMPTPTPALPVAPPSK